MLVHVLCTPLLFCFFASYSKEEECKRVFYIEGLMRCKLTPDDSKLVISTSRGYLLIVHNLDLAHLDVDMEVFKSLETNNRWDPLTSVVANFNSLFERQKNRLEIINDFPEDDKAEIIASLEVGPICFLLPCQFQCSLVHTEYRQPMYIKLSGVPAILHIKGRCINV